MATEGTRKSIWTNADGLRVGYGNNSGATEPGEKNDSQHYAEYALDGAGNFTGLVDPVSGSQFNIYQSHYMSGTLGAVSVPGDFTVTQVPMGEAYMDTHGKVILLDDVIENPFYDVKDAYLTGNVRITWDPKSPVDPADFVGLLVQTGPALGVGLNNVVTQVLRPIIANASVGTGVAVHIPKITLPSTQRYIGFFVAQVDSLSAALSVSDGAFDIEIFG